MANTEYTYNVYFVADDQDEDTFLKIDEVIRAGIIAKGLRGKMRLLEVDFIDSQDSPEVLSDCE